MSDKVPTAKVYVLKDPELGEKGKPWKVGTIANDIFVVGKDCLTHAEAWEWLHENYVRETP